MRINKRKKMEGKKDGFQKDEQKEFGEKERKEKDIFDMYLV